MKYLYVIHLLKKKWMTNYVPLLLQTSALLKPKRGKQELLQIMIVEQLSIRSFDKIQVIRQNRIRSFDKVQDRQGLPNLSAQK